jgi:hypothetical protein
MHRIAQRGDFLTAVSQQSSRLQMHELTVIRKCMQALSFMPGNVIVDLQLLEVNGASAQAASPGDLVAFTVNADLHLVRASCCKNYNLLHPTACVQLHIHVR